MMARCLHRVPSLQPASSPNDIAPIGARSPKTIPSRNMENCIVFPSKTTTLKKGHSHVRLPIAKPSRPYIHWCPFIGISGTPEYKAFILALEVGLSRTSVRVCPGIRCIEGAGPCRRRSCDRLAPTYDQAPPKSCSADCRTLQGQMHLDLYESGQSSRGRLGLAFDRSCCQGSRQLLACLRHPHCH